MIDMHGWGSTQPSSSSGCPSCPTPSSTPPPRSSQGVLIMFNAALRANDPLFPVTWDNYSTPNFQLSLNSWPQIDLQTSSHPSQLCLTYPSIITQQCIHREARTTMAETGSSITPPAARRRAQGHPVPRQEGPNDPRRLFPKQPVQGAVRRNGQAGAGEAGRPSRLRPERARRGPQRTNIYFTCSESRTRRCLNAGLHARLRGPRAHPGHHWGRHPLPQRGLFVLRDAA